MDDFTNSPITKLIEDMKFTTWSFKDIMNALEKGEQYRIGLLSRSPVKVGDIVVLTKTPEISQENAWGWLGSKHFLIKGAVAVVEEVGFWDNKFRFGLKFEKETYIHPTTKKKTKPDSKHQYWFSEGYVNSRNK